MERLSLRSQGLAGPAAIGENASVLVCDFRFFVLTYIRLAMSTLVRCMYRRKAKTTTTLHMSRKTTVINQAGFTRKIGHPAIFTDESGEGPREYSGNPKQFRQAIQLTSFLKINADTLLAFPAAVSLQQINQFFCRPFWVPQLCCTLRESTAHLQTCSSQPCYPTVSSPKAIYRYIFFIHTHHAKTGIVQVPVTVQQGVL